MQKKHATTHFAVYGGCGCYREYDHPPLASCPGHGDPRKPGYARIGLIPAGERGLTYEERKRLHGKA